MAILRDIATIVTADHTLQQKRNCIKYLLSGRSEVLTYSPVTISIVATSRCTLSCDMCPTHSRHVPKDYIHAQQAVKDMDFASFKDIIDRFKNATTVHIIGSGEPLLNKDFFRMVGYAASKKMVVKTFSNGTTVREHIDSILNSALDGITISVNGQDAEEFSRMTGMDGRIYYEVIKAVTDLVEAKRRRNVPLKIKLSFILDTRNYKAIPEMVVAGLRLGVDHIFFCNFLPAPYSGLRADERALVADQDIKAEIESIFKSYPRSIRRKLTPPVLIGTGDGKNECSAHFSQIRFDGDGNVSSCSMMLLNMSGHGHYSDEGVWNNGFFRDMRKRFMEPDGRSLPEPCRACPDNKRVHIGE